MTMHPRIKSMAQQIVVWKCIVKRGMCRHAPPSKLGMPCTIVTSSNLTDTTFLMYLMYRMEMGPSTNSGLAASKQRLLIS